MNRYPQMLISPPDTLEKELTRYSVSNIFGALNECRIYIKADEKFAINYIFRHDYFKKINTFRHEYLWYFNIFRHEYNEY